MSPWTRALVLTALGVAPCVSDAALQVSIVSATAATGTPTFTQDFTDATTFGGATPKAALIFSSRASAENTATAVVALSAGFVAGGNQASVGLLDNDASSTNLAALVSFNTQGYSHAGQAGITIGDATTALIADGLRLSWTDQSNGELIKAVLFGGDIEANVVTLVSNNQQSAQSVAHGLAGAPELIIALSPGNIGANVQNNGNATFGLGFWTASAQNGIAALLNQNAQANVTAAARLSSTQTTARIDNGTSFAWAGTISNVGATTFDVTMSANTTNVMYFLVMRSTSGTPLAVKTGTFTTPTSTGNVADVTGLSVSPQALLTVGSRLTALDTGSTNDSAGGLSVGVAVKNTGSGVTQYATAAVSEDDALATSGNHAFSQTSNTENIRILDIAGAADVEATVNSWDAGGITHNYSNINASPLEVVYLALSGAAAVAPTFSVSATVSAQDDNDYTLAYTASTVATFYAVACVKDSTAPSIAQVKAAHCTGDVAAQAAANEAVTGADTTVLGGSLTLPIYDLYAVLSNGAGDSALVTLADEMLDAPSGKQYVTLASISATSWCTDFNALATPDIAAVDILKIDLATSPSAFTWTQGTDCDGSYTGDASRQSLTYDVYDASVGAYMTGGPGTIWFNNLPPFVPAASENLIFTFPLNVPITPIDLTALCEDPEADAITVTAVDALPTGLSVVASTLQGTPTVGGIYSSVTFRCTDAPGDSVDLD